MADKTFLIIFRHGQYIDDFLTDKGKEQINSAAIALKNCDINPDIIITSTPIRAMQSGAILQQHFNAAVSIPERDLMFDNPCNRAEIDDALDYIPKNYNNIVLVGHYETVNGFNYGLLSEKDGLKLMSMIESESYRSFIHGSDKSVSTSAETGDALILSTARIADNDLIKANWDLHGYIRAGKIYLASDASAAPDFPVVKKYAWDKRNYSVIYSRK